MRRYRQSSNMWWYGLLIFRLPGRFLLLLFLCLITSAYHAADRAGVPRVRPQSEAPWRGFLRA
jgi:hypothetical protein